MFIPAHKKVKVALVNAPIEIPVSTQVDMHQVTIIGVGVLLTQGTIPVFIKTSPDSEYQPLLKDDLPYEIVIVAGGVRSFEIPNGSISSILLGNVDPNGVVAAPVNGTEWKVRVISGNKG